MKNGLMPFRVKFVEFSEILLGNLSDRKAAKLLKFPPDFRYWKVASVIPRMNVKFALCNPGGKKV